MDDIDEIFPQFEFLGDATPFVARIHDIIEHIRLFEDLDEDEIAHIARHLLCYRAPAGAEIIHEGDNGDFMILLLEGSMEITRQDANGMPVLIGQAGPGKTLGEMSLIDGEPRFASCVSAEPVLIGVIDRDGLSRIIADNPRLGVKLLMQMLILLNQRLRLVSAELVGSLGKNPDK